MPASRRPWVVSTIVVLLAAAGCHVPADETGPSSEPTEGSGIGPTLAPMVERLMAELTVPGVVVAIKTPEEEWTQAFGRRSLSGRTPLTVDDHFRIGSNTKTMTGTCLLQLVDEGKVALTDLVTEHLPELDDPKLQEVTVAQLLDMRSGLSSYTELESFNAALDAEPERAWQPTELVRIGLAEPVDFPPGTDFHYSNTNTVLAGLIVEHHDQVPLAESFRRRITDRLGLFDTTLPDITSNAVPEPHPRGYMYGTNVSTLTTQALPVAEQEQAYAGTLRPTDYTDANPSWGWAAGAGISTAEDLTTYVEALIGGGLLSQQLQEQRLDSIRPAGPEPDSAGYGLALARFGPMLGHDGSLPGFSSFMGHDPSTETTLIVLTTLQSSPDGKMVANEIARPIIGELAKG